MEELTKRLNQAVRYLVWKGYVSIQSTQKDIAEKMGTTTSNVSAALKGSERFLTDGFVYRFSNAFKGIFNEKWIISGNGDMTNDNVSITDTPTTDKDIKILDIRVCAGHGIGFDGEENKVIGYVNIPEFTGCYGITVYGDSMYNTYMSGDTIFVREINDRRSIDNGQPYLIITKEDRLLKMIHIDYEQKRTILSSFNNITNPDGKRKYPDMEIDIDNDVLHLYKVVGKLARTQM